MQEEEYVARIDYCGVGLVYGLGEAVAEVVVVVDQTAVGEGEDSLGHLDGQTSAKETDHVLLEYGEYHYVAGEDDLDYGLDGEELEAVRVGDKAIARPVAVEAAVAAAVESAVASVEHGFLAVAEMAVALGMPIEGLVAH